MSQFVCVSGQKMSPYEPCGVLSTDSIPITMFFHGPIDVCANSGYQALLRSHAEGPSLGMRLVLDMDVLILVLCCI